MLKKALDQERAASADLRWILCSRKRELPDVQDASPSASATPIGDDLVTVISLTSVAAPWAPGDLGAANLPKSPEDGGLSAGYPDFGYGLTRRQLQILGLVLAGHPSKNIAADLGISRRTVESHRAAIMHRTGATSLPALARLAVGADVGGDCKLVARS
ncbi:MAG: LuxR C-terminal-related transcriptional regulator [Paracoccaceae bacterium]